MKHILLLASFVAVTVFAQDTIVFKNGDMLTGKILKKDQQHIDFQSPLLGTINLNTADIDKIQTKAPETSKIEPAAEAPQPTTTKLAVQQIAKETPSAPPQAPMKEKKQWTGQAGLEIAMREKNTTRLSNGNIINRTENYETYRIYGDLNWRGERNNLRWHCTYRYSQDEIKKRDDFFNVTQKYNHRFPDGLYYTEAKTVYQRDYNRQIENEFLQTAEIGRKWFDRPKFSFFTSFGGGYHRFDRIVGGTETQTQEPQLIIDQAIRWQMINSLTLFQKYTHLGDLEKYHFIFTAGVENKLIHDVFLRVEYRLDRDTEVSYDDKGYFDKALRTSLLYKF